MSQASSCSSQASPCLLRTCFGPKRQSSRSHSCAIPSCALTASRIAHGSHLATSQLLNTILSGRQCAKELLRKDIRHTESLCSRGPPCALPAAVEPHPTAKTGGVARWWRNKFSSKKTRKSTPSYTTLQVQPRGTSHLYLLLSLDMQHAFDCAYK